MSSALLGGPWGAGGRRHGGIGNGSGLRISFLCDGMVMMTKPWPKRGEHSEPTQSGGRQLVIVELN